MTNDELNQYIKHYIEKDRTSRAIMLTGAWGVGKSYYIKNTLIPFLSEEINGKHQCIVVSLYGLSDLSEVSKAIYLETRMRKIRIESEKGKAAILAAKTVLKGVASHFGVELTADEKDLQTLYESVDLSGKLIILEDVERTSINLIELLGYVNSLVEQDSVKVMLVTNEDEIIQYKPAEQDEKDGGSNGYKGTSSSTEKPVPKQYTEETLRYLQTKEKTIGDTINFSGDLKSAVLEIMGNYTGQRMQTISTEEIASDIVDLMCLLGSMNLRSIIFACQKTADVFEYFSSDYSADFLKTVFYGIAAFSLRMHTGASKKWTGMDEYSEELGIRSYPLFRFCYDYIVTQHMDISSIPKAAACLEKLRLYDPEKTSRDPDVQTLLRFHVHTEAEVKNAVASIANRLKNINDISFGDYGRIASALVTAKYALGIDITDIKALLINNLKGRGFSIRGNDLFWQTISGDSKGEQQEFLQLREDMIRSLSDGKGLIPDFDYLPAQASMFYEYVTKNDGAFYTNHGFAKFLDMPRFVRMFFDGTPEQMDRMRASFVSLYRASNVKDFLAGDLQAIDELISALEKGREEANIDKVQQMQCKWFIDNLNEIKYKLT